MLASTPKDHLTNHAGHHVADTWAAILLALAQEGVDGVTDNPRQEDNEGIDHTLNQGQGHHVAVGDVRHLVGENRLGLFTRHALQQAGRHGDQ
jgi:hypothetical protein